MAVYDEDEKFAQDSSEPELGSDEWRKNSALSGGPGVDSNLGLPDTDPNGRHYSWSSNQYAYQREQAEDAARNNDGAANKDELAAQESNPGSGSSEGGGSSGSSEHTTGEAKNGRGENKKKDRSLANKLVKGKSVTGKRIGIALAFGGGSILISLLFFFLMLPLKIEHIIQNAESYYGAAADRAVGKETENLFDGYLKKAVLPALQVTGPCRSTAHPGCTGTITATGPVGQLYEAWKKNRLENKLASKYGIVISRSGPNYFMTMQGHNIDLNEVRAGRTSVFDLPGTRGMSRNEIRESLRGALRGGTLWDRTYGRFVYGRYLERQFGIKRCIIACKLKDKFADKIADKKLAAKAILLQRFVPEKYAIILQCVLLGGCSDDLSPASPGDETRQTDGQRKIKTALLEAADKFAGETLKDLAEKSREIAKDGIAKYVAKTITKKIATAIFGDTAGQVAGQIAEKAIPIIGWVILVAKIIHTAATAGPMVQHMAYAANTATAIATSEAYDTVASEMKSGNVDPIELGSFADSLSTNLSGSKNDQCDATQSKLYNYVVEGNGPTPAPLNTASITDALFGTASAASAKSNYCKCEDGNPPPPGKQVCDMEKFDRGNKALNAVSDFINNIPVIPQLATVINWIADKVSVVTGFLGTAVMDTCKYAIPFCGEGLDKLQTAISNLLSPLFAMIQKWVIPTPFTDNMDGGRTVDMILAGKDAGHNSTLLNQLGAPRSTPAAVQAIRDEQNAEDKYVFEHQSMFARMFDTSSQYSLISRLAVSMPGNLQNALTNSATSFLSNPFGNLLSTLGSAFRPMHAFAAQVALPDPFGVIQYAYQDDQIPSDPEKAWKDNNCDDPNQVANWMNNDGTQDPNTGEMTTTKPNVCLLIKSTIQSAGGMFDPSLLPPGGAGDDAKGGSTGGSASTQGNSIPTGTAQQLATQILGDVNISFQTPDELTAMQHIAQTGHATQCGAPAISPTLLGVILKLSQSYKIVVGVLTDGHPCDGKHHQDGSAVDINGINPLNGGVGTGTHITYAPNELPIIKQFYATAGQVLAANGGGGLGQYGVYDGQQCFSDSLPPQVPGVTYFPDQCNHLHLDTRGH